MTILATEATQKVRISLKPRVPSCRKTLAMQRFNATSKPQQFFCSTDKFVLDFVDSPDMKRSAKIPSTDTNVSTTFIDDDSDFILARPQDVPALCTPETSPGASCSSEASRMTCHPSLKIVGLSLPNPNPLAMRPRVAAPYNEGLSGSIEASPCLTPKRFSVAPAFPELRPSESLYFSDDQSDAPLPCHLFLPDL